MDSLAQVLALFEPNRTVYIPGASGELLGLIPALCADPGKAAGLTFIGCFVPGLNEFDYAAVHESTRIKSFMLPKAMRASFREHKIDLIPCAYSGAAAYLEKFRVDLALAHAGPPNTNGLCSLGVANDFTPLIWPKAKQRVLVINHAMPKIQRAVHLPIAEADLIVEIDAPVVSSRAPAEAPVLAQVASNVAQLIPDGATIQTGIGGAPEAVLRALTSHRDLVLRSGMVTDGIARLAASGALAPNADHCAGIAYGPRDFYHWLAAHDLVRFAAVNETHGAAALLGVRAFHAINSALEVDLFGQANVEWQAGSLSSGVGGSPDFARAALASPGGRSILAMPATAKSGAVSRIVPNLAAPSVSLCRSLADTIVTEYGVAELRHLGMDARADALIAIAAPIFRETLRQSWRSARSTY